MTKRIFFVLQLFIIMVAMRGYAQRENVWTFGDRTLLDFNKIQNGYPTPGRHGMYGFEGCASVCDSNGNLLFYTNGSTVYNRNHDTMLNGDIFPVYRTQSTTQAALIVPMPGEHMYYVFSLTQPLQVSDTLYYYSALYYSIVDINLDGGLGGVVPDRKTIYIDSGFSEQLTSIPGLYGDVWVLASKHIMHNSQVRYPSALKIDTQYSIWAYHISAQGSFNSTAVVTGGLPNTFIQMGSLIPSPDYTKLVDARGRITIYQFDRRRGVPYSPITLPGIDYQDSVGKYYNWYGAAFSPNNRYLYTSVSHFAVYQFDLHNYNTDSIFKSRVKMFESGSGGLKLGPDGKIYAIDWVGQPISIIEQPNEKGMSSKPMLRYLPLLSGTATIFGLPNIINMPGNFEIVNHIFDTCISSWPHLLTPTHDEGEFFEWSTGDSTATIEVDEPGIYRLTYVRGRYYHVDSFFVGDYNNRIKVEVTAVLNNCFGYYPGKASVSIAGVSANDFECYWLNVDSDTLSKAKQIDSLKPGNYQLIVRQQDCINLFPISIEENFSNTFFPFELVTRHACGSDSSGWAYLHITDDSAYAYKTTWKRANGAVLQQGGDTIMRLPSGNYELYIQTEKCDTTVTFSIERINDIVDFELKDTIWCQDMPYAVKNTSGAHYTHFIWTGNGDTLSTAYDLNVWVSQVGEYNITLLGMGELCTMAKSQRIMVDSAYQNSFSTDKTVICQGEAIELYMQQEASQSRYHWYINGEAYRQSRPEQRDAMSFDKPGIYTLRLTTQFRACPDTSYAQQIVVQPIPLVYLGADSTICLHGSAIELSNRLMEPSAKYGYEWSTGNTGPTLTVKHPGRYSLSVSDITSGCTGQAGINIANDCYTDIPNAFSPNGDGINDYFFPRQLLSSGVTSFHMQVFDRWGQKIFETTNAEGRGWDGRFNGKDQPNGIYIYLVEIAFTNGRQERYEGNVTLMR